MLPRTFGCVVGDAGRGGEARAGVADGHPAPGQHPPELSHLIAAAARCASAHRAERDAAGCPLPNVQELQSSAAGVSASPRGFRRPATICLSHQSCCFETICKRILVINCLQR